MGDERWGRVKDDSGISGSTRSNLGCNCLLSIAQLGEIWGKVSKFKGKKER